MKLTKRILKSGKREYKTYNDAGEVINTRMSTRDYVAATLCGSYYFGRLDLIGKGDHGRAIKRGDHMKICYLES